jgi:uncharacterized membrane protein YsdA (DUF1294 family)/cold shock CspA family protein
MTPSPEARMEGELQSWKDDRGFGFLTLPTGDRTLFVHIREFEGRGARPLVGTRYSFEIERVDGGKPRAVRVRPLDGIPARAPREPREREHPGRRAPRPTSASWLALLVFIVLYMVLNVLWDIPIWVAAAYAVLSLVSLGQYAVDKRAARLGRWRIPESTLQFTSLIGGWPGSIAAQQFLRHKTRKTAFLRDFWVVAIVNILGFLVIVMLVRGNLVEMLNL